MKERLAVALTDGELGAFFPGAARPELMQLFPETRVFTGEGSTLLAQFLRENGPRTVLFDVHDWTHHPDNPAPQGLTHYNPMKVYTSAEIAEFLHAQGAAVQVDWDDFAQWQGRTPEDDE